MLDVILVSFGQTFICHGGWCYHYCYKVVVPGRAKVAELFTLTFAFTLLAVHTLGRCPMQDVIFAKQWGQSTPWSSCSFTYTGCYSLTLVFLLRQNAWQGDGFFYFNFFPFSFLAFHPLECCLMLDAFVFGHSPAPCPLCCKTVLTRDILGNATYLDAAGSC